MTGPPTYLARRNRLRLEGAEAEALARQLEQLRFFELPAKLDAGQDKPDATSFGITVSDGTRSHTVEFSGAAGGTGFAQLIRWLNSMVGQP
jgi:hypothetical protein